MRQSNRITYCSYSIYQQQWLLNLYRLIYILRFTIHMNVRAEHTQIVLSIISDFRYILRTLEYVPTIGGRILHVFNVLGVVGQNNVGYYLDFI